jgi:hypothetical protein
LTAISPRRELIDLAVGMPVDEPGKDVIEIDQRIDVVQFAVSIKEATTAQCSARPNPRTGHFYKHETVEVDPGVLAKLAENLSAA